MAVTMPMTTECLGINAEFLHADGMNLFHLGALRHLMRCVSLSLRPSAFWKLVAADTVVMD